MAGIKTAWIFTAFVLAAPAFASAPECTPESSAFLDRLVLDLAKAQQEELVRFVQDTFSPKGKLDPNDPQKGSVAKNNRKILKYYQQQMKKDGENTALRVGGAGIFELMLSIGFDSEPMAGATLEQLRFLKIGYQESLAANFALRKIAELERAGAMSPLLSTPLSEFFIDNAESVKFIGHETNAAMDAAVELVPEAKRPAVRAGLKRLTEEVPSFYKEISRFRSADLKLGLNSLETTAQIDKAILQRVLARAALKTVTMALNIMIVSDLLRGDRGVGAGCPVIREGDLSLYKLLRKPQLILENLKDNEVGLCRIVNRYFTWKSQRTEKSSYCEFELNLFKFTQEMRKAFYEGLRSEWLIIKEAVEVREALQRGYAECPADATRLPQMNLIFKGEYHRTY